MIRNSSLCRSWRRFVWLSARAFVSEQSFPRVTTAYLWTLAICETTYNYIVLYTNTEGLDFLAELPLWVFVVGVAMGMPRKSASPFSPIKPFALFIDQVRPMAFGLVLVTLSAMIFGQHFSIAIGVIVGAFIIYGMRSAILQSRLVQTQHELVNARQSP